MKRVLFIAYAFPPCGGAGVQRSTKFVRYLPEFGWMPTVLTVNPSCYAVKDDSHTADLEKVDVIRTWHFDPLASFGRRNSQSSDNGSNTNGSTRRIGPATAARRLARNAWMVAEKNLLIPDTAVLWYPKGVVAGWSALRRERFDLIYATGEPYSSYFIARTLSRLSNIPFVIDMRDPWTLAPYRRERRSSMRMAIERTQERDILAECAAAIFANRANELYADAFPDYAGKFHYIPNGFDSCDLYGVEPKQFEKLTIVHSGTFLPGYRTADTFLSALRSLEDSKKIAARIQVIFVGKVGEERKQIERHSLGSIVRQTGYVPHAESIAHLKGADVLLLVGGEERWEETGKIYEYMATGKPILALIRPDGAAADLLRNYRDAMIVDREDISGTVESLKKILVGSREANSKGDVRWAQRFERRALTSRLVEVFEGCEQGVTPSAELFIAARRV